MNQTANEINSRNTVLGELPSSLSPLMQEVLNKVMNVAPTRTTVLLMGETGVGKGVMARLIHRHSSRHKGPFVQVHCGAITETLIESEFFGHEKGSFTGATKRKLGKFELAHGGTIFLDEISTLTPPAQIRLLQILQEGAFHRVGGEEEVRVDTRVIAACNEDLKYLVETGEFRRDLYYRLNIFPIQVPSLRDRPEDLEDLINHFLTRLQRAFTKNIEGVTPEALALLKIYCWPGNIRELENLIERAFILERGPSLSLSSFPPEILGVPRVQPPLLSQFDLPLAQARLKVLEDFEKQYLFQILTRSKGRIAEAARVTGVGVRQLSKLMRKYNLHKEDFKISHKGLAEPSGPE